MEVNGDLAAGVRKRKLINKRPGKGPWNVTITNKIKSFTPIWITNTVIIVRIIDNQYLEK